MAGSVNKVILVGNLGADPEIRSTNSGTRIANLRLATSESWRDRSTGERKEKTEWHRVTVWGDGIVEIIEKYVRKGSKLYIEGKLQTRKWQGNDGRDNYSTEVVVQGFGTGITLLDGSRDGGNRSRGDDTGGDLRNREPDPAYDRGAVGGSRARNPNDDLDDEIPF